MDDVDQALLALQLVQVQAQLAVGLDADSHQELLQLPQGLFAQGEGLKDGTALAVALEHLKDCLQSVITAALDSTHIQLLDTNQVLTLGTTGEALHTSHVNLQFSACHLLFPPTMCYYSTGLMICMILS